MKEKITLRVQNSFQNAQKIMTKWHIPKKVFQNYQKINLGFSKNEDERLRGAILNPRYIGTYYRRHGLAKTIGMVKRSENAAFGIASNKEKQNTLTWLQSIGFDQKDFNTFATQIYQANLRKEMRDIRTEVKQLATDRGIYIYDES